MSRTLRVSFWIPLIVVLQTVTAHAGSTHCRGLLGLPTVGDTAEWLKKTAVHQTLNLMAVSRGLPKYRKLIKDANETGSYEAYDNFGEMGLAEMGISVRYNAADAAALDTGRPLIIVANHHLGIADGLALQYLTSKFRPDPEKPSLLFLARWIEKLLPFAVYDEKRPWGTAVPVDINKPKKPDPDYDAKMAEINEFNSKHARPAARVLRWGGALIIFPAGHVAAVNAGEAYPDGVRDAVGSWQEGYLGLARLGKADIVFANVASVNRKAFYKNRKRFGGGDLERVIWFLGEALRKRGKAVDVHLSKPMSLEEVYGMLAAKHETSPEVLKDDPGLMTERMRQHTYEFFRENPRGLDAQDSPVKKKLAKVSP